MKYILTKMKYKTLFVDLVEVSLNDFYLLAMKNINPNSIWFK